MQTHSEHHEEKVTISETDAPVTKVSKSSIVKNAITKPSGRAIALMAILAVLLIGGGFWIYSKIKNNSARPKETAQDIQQAFRPDPVPAPTAPQVSPPVTEPAPIPNPSPIRGTTAPVTQNSPAPTPPKPSVYSNNQLGIRLILPHAWQAAQTSGNSVALTSNNGQTIGSSSVTQTFYTQYLGKPAVGFLTSTAKQGRAFLHDNTVYYVMAHNVHESPLDSLQLH